MKMTVVIIGLLLILPGAFLLATGMDKVNYYESPAGQSDRDADQQERDYYEMYQWFQVWGALLLVVGLLVMLLGFLMRGRTRPRPQSKRRAATRRPTADIRGEEHEDGPGSLDNDEHLE